MLYFFQFTGDLDEHYYLYLTAVGVVLSSMMLFIFLLVNRIRVEKVGFILFK